MTKLKKMRIGFYASLSVSVLVVAVAIGLSVNAFSGSNNGTVMESVNMANVTIEAAEMGMEDSLGAIAGPNVYYDMVFHKTIKFRENTRDLVNVADNGTTTLTALDSGSTILLSGTGTDIVLPAVTYTGFNAKFVINGASGVANWIIDSAEGDNIEGTLIVAGAVVDCAAEDQINFVVDGENIGDYFELTSDGTQWLLGDSGVLSSSKLTCTDPS